LNEDQLEEIKKAYASGVLRVRFGDQEIVYKSTEEMLSIISYMERRFYRKGLPEVKPLSYGGLG
jgi:hypothetical protein